MPLAFDRERFLANARAAQDGPARGTGATKIIERALPDIDALRAEGVAWKSIARALAAQGAVQGPDARPIEERRLTALIAGINRRKKTGAKKLPPLAQDRRRRPEKTGCSDERSSSHSGSQEDNGEFALIVQRAEQVAALFKDGP